MITPITLNKGKKISLALKIRVICVIMLAKKEQSDKNYLIRLICGHLESILL